MKLNEVHESCLICGSDAILPVSGYGSAHLVKCNTCSFVFSHRIPSHEELTKIYEEDYTRTDYLSPVTVKRFNELLDEFEPFRKTNKIIDIGCGNGDFLVEAVKRGWEAYGTEFSEHAVRVCKEKGLIVSQGVFNPEQFNEGGFDVAVSFEVIEHINNPVEEIRKMNRVLRSGGLVYCTTPNFSSLSRRIYKSDWIMIEYPEHLSYYTPRSIRYLFSSNGFRNLKTKTTGFRSSNKPIPEILTTDSRDEKLRNMAEGNILVGFLKRFINQVLSMFNAGDTIKAYFIKK